MIVLLFNSAYNHTSYVPSLRSSYSKRFPYLSIEHTLQTSFSIMWFAGISFCTINTSLHTEQCEPSVNPDSVHVAATALSNTTVCPNAGTTTFSRLNSTSHTVQYTTKSYWPSSVHVGNTLFSVNTSLFVWPNASTTSCATNTLLHTEQCEPSVKPVSVHVAVTALSNTTVCPNAGTTTFSRLNSTSHTVQYTTKSYWPSSVHVGNTLFSMNTSLFVCPNASTTSCATNTSLHTPQCFPSVSPVDVHVAAAALSNTTVCPNAGTTSCSINTSLHTLQWLPSVKPVNVHVGATASSTTTVWPKDGTTTISRLNSTSHTVQYVANSYRPFFVHVGNTLFSVNTLLFVWPNARIDSNVV